MRRHQERVRSQKCYNREIEKQVDICGGHLKPVISIIKLTDGNKINNSSQQSLFDQAFLHIPILKILKNALQKIALFFFYYSGNLSSSTYLHMGGIQSFLYCTESWKGAQECFRCILKHNCYSEFWPATQKKGETEHKGNAKRHSRNTDMFQAINKDKTEIQVRGKTLNH